MGNIALRRPDQMFACQGPLNTGPHAWTGTVCSTPDATAWTGVACSDGHVTAISLYSLGLSGEAPAAAEKIAR